MDGADEKRLVALMSGKKLRSRLRGLQELSDAIGAYPHMSLDLFGVFMKEVENLLVDVHFIARTMEEHYNEQA